MGPEIDPDPRRRYQSQLSAAQAKFARGNQSDGRHFWLTPPEVLLPLQAEFNGGEPFFDPCPCPLPPGFNGLEIPWQSPSYVNPPFGSVLVPGRKRKQGMTAWVRKALLEQRRGVTVLLVHPLDKWLPMLFEAIGASESFRNLGDVRWLAVEDGTAGTGTGRHIGLFILHGLET